MISRFELDNLKEIKAKYLSGGQKKISFSISIIKGSKVLFDEPFYTLDVLTIKMLQEIIVNLQQESSITVIICDHIASYPSSC